MNFNFLKAFPFTEIIALTTFYLSYQNIQIRPVNMNAISFKTNNNIINEYSSEYLKHLIRFAYLKKELHRPSNLFQNNFSQAYIINSEIIDKLKKIYNLKELIINLDKNKILNEITYQNFDDNYLKISNFLNKNQVNYINSIKKIETENSIEFTENEKSLKIKYLCNQIKLKYLNGFEIIDIRFATFLKKIFNNIVILPVIFAAITNNKILTIINEEERHYYEIFSLDPSNILTFECLMQILVNKIVKDKNYLNGYILNFLIKNDLSSLKSKGNPISLENNNFKFCLYFKDIYYYDPNIKKNNRSLSLSTTNTLQDDESSTTSYNLNRYKSKKNMTFQFKTESMKYNVIIKIDSDKTINELIKLFFANIKHPELFGDRDIFFLGEGKKLSYNSGGLIQDYFRDIEKVYVFVVVDFGADRI